MQHYLELRILPDPEFVPTVLMNAIYNKLHHALVKLNSNEIGVSFPDYDQEKSQLGSRLRMHGSEEILQRLMQLPWLTGLRDHIRIGEINTVPPKVNHVVFQRIQVKTNAERLRRRQMQRHNLAYEDAIKKIPDAIEKRLQLPFIILKSQSTTQTFRIYIKQEKVMAEVKDNFNTYGLSKLATVPLFG